MKVKELLFIAIGIAAAAIPARAEDITFATWNIANLHHETGVSLRTDSVVRRDIDYERLAAIGASLDADVIALQEIGSPAALARIFPAENYHLIISDRYQKGDENRPAEERDIYTALVISKARFPDEPKVETVSSLSIEHVTFDRRTGRVESRPTRSGMLFEFELAGQPVSFLNLHLKSSCHSFPLDVIEDQNFFTGQPFGSRFDCRTLKAQLAILENLIEAKQAAGRSVVVAGDLNRRLNVVYRNPTRYEDFWADLNDGEPDGLELVKGPEGEDTVCWPKHAERYLEHIDFIIADKKLVSASEEAEFRKLGMGFDDDSEYADKYRQRLSDHCPVVLRLSL